MRKLLDYVPHVLGIVAVVGVLVAGTASGYLCGHKRGVKHLQDVAVRDGLGAYLLDISDGKVKFVWLTPFGPQLPGSHPYNAGYTPVSNKCHCPSACDCGCQSGGPCHCEG